MWIKHEEVWRRASESGRDVAELHEGWSLGEGVK